MAGENHNSRRPETQANMVESQKRRRQRERDNGGIPKHPNMTGSRNPRVLASNITEDIVREIRMLEPYLKRSIIAKMFGLDIWNIRNIQQRRRWKHVE
jgi:hypothetical protein